MAMYITDTKSFYPITCLLITLTVAILISGISADAAVDEKYRRCLAL